MSLSFSQAIPFAAIVMAALLTGTIVLAVLVRQKTQQLEQLRADHQQLMLAKSADENRIRVLEDHIRMLEWEKRQTNP